MPINHSAIHFHDKLASSWSGCYKKSSFNLRLQFLQLILSRFVSDGCVWADVGCGSGNLSAYICSRSQARVFCIDGSVLMLEAAKASIPSQYLPLISFHNYDLDSSEPLILQEKCSGILLSSVIEYSEDPSSILGFISRNLQPGGVLVITIPPKLSLVRITQKLIRLVSRTFGFSFFDYLQYSKFELSPSISKSFFSTHNLQVDNIFPFDPILPHTLLRLIPPSLYCYVCTYRDDLK